MSSRHPFQNRAVLGSKPPVQAPEIAGRHFSISEYGHPRFAAFSVGWRARNRQADQTHLLRSNFWLSDYT
jgi:hypothetical protein